MTTSIQEDRDISILVDGQHNLAIFSRYLNPSFDGNYGKTPVDFPAKTPIELLFPYTVDQVALAIKQGMDSYNMCEPYIAKDTIEEHYYQIKGFKAATLGKKMIDVGWSRLVGKNVRVNLATKRGKGYLCIAEKLFPDDASWEDFAQAVIEFATMDLTKTRTFRSLKSYLNV